MKKQPSLITRYSPEVQLLLACKMDNLANVKKLLSTNAIDPSFQNNKPLECCCENGRDEIAAYLLTYPGVTFEGNSALELAVKFGHTRCARLATNAT